MAASAPPAHILGEFMMDMRINGIAQVRMEYAPRSAWVSIDGNNTSDPTLRVVKPYGSMAGIRADIVVFDGTAAVASIDPIVARAVRQETVLTRLAPGGVVLDIP